MKVGDLVRPAKHTEGWEDPWTWVGLVTAMSSDDLTGADCVIVRWNRERFESEEEYCHQMEVINESR